MGVIRLVINFVCSYRIGRALHITIVVECECALNGLKLVCGVHSEQLAPIKPVGKSIQGPTI